MREKETAKAPLSISAITVFQHYYTAFDAPPRVPSHRTSESGLQLA